MNFSARAITDLTTDLNQLPAEWLLRDDIGTISGAPSLQWFDFSGAQAALMAVPAQGIAGSGDVKARVNDPALVDPNASTKNDDLVGDGVQSFGSPVGLFADSAPSRGSVAADLVPGTTATTATLAVGGGVDVSIDTLGDHDWYGVTLTAGVQYTFRTSGTGTGADSFLTLRDAAGAVISSDDDGGGGTLSLIGYTPTTSGTFYIDASTFNDESTATYHLTLAATPLAGSDTIAASNATTGTISVGGAVNVRIDTSGDHDWYAITLTAGQTYLFQTNITVVGAAGDNPDTTLALRDSAGTQLAFNDDAGGNYSAIRYTATTSGTFYLDVAGFSTNTGTTNLTAVQSVPLIVFTNDQIALQLTNGYWGGGSHHFNVAAGGTLTYNVVGLTAAGATLARNALALWTDVTGIVFSEIVTAAQITFDDNQTGAFAQASYSAGITSSATVNVGTAWLTSYGTGTNSYSFQTYIHEIGHALGLGHAGSYNGSAAYATDALYLNDSWATTIMSYFDQQQNSYFAGLGFTREFALSPMVADGIALANLYGANTLTRTGNTTYGFNNTSGRDIYDASVNPSIAYTIYDNGGTDTLDYSGFSQNQIINLNPEAFSSIGARVGNVSIARGSVIENAIGGSGNDTITGNDVANTLRGGLGNDTLDGRGGDDLFMIDDGGTDTVIGGLGNDSLFAGGAFDGSDSFDGGAGTLDSIGLQGTYAGLTLGAGATIGVELVVLLPGDDTRFINLGGANTSYNLTLVDANIAAGQTLAFQANALRAGENFTLNAAAETDGRVITYAGLGTETITGGAGDDGFYFGQGRFSTLESLNGGVGFDSLAFQGDFAGANAVTLGASQLVSIEIIVFLSGADSRFGNFASTFSYTVTTNDGNVAAGQTLGIQANDLRAGEVLTFNGSAETNGNFQVFGGAGADSITGGAGADRILGLGGADQLTGGAGNDIFAYNAASDSTVSARDHIVDFATGDSINLGQIDANSIGGTTNDTFTFIGSSAFSNVAGQLHAINTVGNVWLIEGDVNGDGVADLSILVTVSDAHVLGSGDFVL